MPINIKYAYKYLVSRHTLGMQMNINADKY